MAKILIVEDEAIVAMATRMMLGNLTHEIVASYSTAEQMLEEVGKKEVDLILMDIKLKGTLDGIQAAEKIRETQNTPILFITGNSDNKTKQRIQQIGNSFMLQKPVMLEDLRFALHKLLN